MAERDELHKREEEEKKKKQEEEEKILHQKRLRVWNNLNYMYMLTGMW